MCENCKDWKEKILASYIRNYTFLYLLNNKYIFRCNKCDSYYVDIKPSIDFHYYFKKATKKEIKEYIIFELSRSLNVQEL